MKRITIYAILAKAKTGENIILMTGSKKEIEKTYKDIIGDSITARWIKTEKGKFLIYGYGSKRTTRPDLIKPIMIINDPYEIEEESK